MQEFTVVLHVKEENTYTATLSAESLDEAKQLIKTIDDYNIHGVEFLNDINMVASGGSNLIGGYVSE